MKKWRDANKVKAKQATASWLARNPGYLIEWRKTYIVQASAASRRSYIRNKATRDMKKVAAASKKWRKAHPDKQSALANKRRALQRGAEGSYTADQWTRLKEFHGNVCLCCGVHDSISRLTVDHVIPLVKGGSHYITNIQPLCKNCNCRKRDKDTDYRNVCLLEAA